MGPYTPKNRYGADTWELMADPVAAQAEAQNAAMASVGMGQPTDTATRATPDVDPEGDPSKPKQGRRLSFGVNSPEYGWRVSQEDLGQGEVQQIRTDNFVTPVAMQRYPAGAVAARQHALADRRAKVDEAKEKARREFDPFAKLEDPAAQHQYAWSQYTTQKWWPQMVQQYADAYGIGKDDAIERFVNTTEGQLYLKQQTQMLNAAAKQSRDITERAMQTLADIQEGKTEFYDPEDMKALVDYLNAMDPQTGGPLTNVMPTDILGLGVKANAAMALGAFKQQFLGDFEKFAEQELSNSVAAEKGGNYRLTEEVGKKFDEFKDGMMMAAEGLGIDKNRARAFMDKIIKDRKEREIKIFANGYVKAGGGGGRPTSASFAGVNEIPIPEGVYTIKSGPNAGKIDEAMAANTRGKTYKALSLFDVSNNKGVTPQARTFSNTGMADGTRMGKGAGKVHAIATDIVRVGNELFILAKKAPELRVKSTSGSDSDGYTLNTSEDEGGVDWQTFNELPPILINYEMNKGALPGMFPGITDDFVRQQLGPWDEAPKKATAKQGLPDFVKNAGYSQSDWDAITPSQQQKIISAGKL